MEKCSATRYVANTSRFLAFVLISIAKRKRLFPTYVKKNIVAALSFPLSASSTGAQHHHE